MKLSLIQYKQNQLYDFKNKPYITPKRRLELRDLVVDENISLIKEACMNGADIILTSECINFSGVPLDTETFDIIEKYETGRTFKLLLDLSSKYNSMIIAGLSNMRDNKAYNSAIVFKNGKIAHVYDKINLAGDENTMMTPGQDFCTFDTVFGKVGLLVCWDMQQPETVDSLAKTGAKIILCPTWGWENQYGLDCAKRNNVLIAAAMAIPYETIDNGLIDDVRSPSMLVSTDGTIIAEASRTEPCVLTIDID